tara:strand:- start:1 stop:1149 length:1149 start_codon:yes stop_codon:yes gene_type:complete
MKSKIKIILAFGTRPEAIKMAPLYHALKNHPEDFDVLVCVTAQHREMLDQVLKVFNIVPDIDLDLMERGQDLFDVTSSVLLGMRDVLKEHKPDILLVHGDTATTMSSSIAGFYSNIRIGHIEAGLRTFDMQSPFPEEFNRQVTTKISNLHFAPTKISKENLLNENILDKNIFVTGNTVIDALFWMLETIESDSKKKAAVTKFLDSKLKFNWTSDKFVLITGHRRENFGSGFLEICDALKESALAHPNIEFVYPVHLNPNVMEPVESMLKEIKNIHLISPLDYEPFVYLLKHSYFVLTDSGGIQEEAPSLGKPVLVMRDITERPEAIEAGTVKLVGANKIKIMNGIKMLITNEELYESMSLSHNPYGDGDACKKIINVLRDIK